MSGKIKIEVGPTHLRFTTTSNVIADSAGSHYYRARFNTGEVLIVSGFCAADSTVMSNTKWRKTFYYVSRIFLYGFSLVYDLPNSPLSFLFFFVLA